MSSMLDAIGGPGAIDPQGGIGAPPPMEAPEAREPSEILTEIKGLIQEYIDSDDSDEQETAQATKALVIVQGLLASEEKNMEAAAGTTPAHKAMAKQINSLVGA